MRMNSELQPPQLGAHSGGFYTKSGVRRVATTVCMLLASACSQQAPLIQRVVPVATAPAPKEPEDTPTRLGTIDRQPILARDLKPEIQAELLEIDNELKQRTLHLSWVGFEDLINERLLKNEAKRRGITVTALINELSADIQIGDDEIEKIYDDNKASIPVSLEEARPAIVRQLEAAAKQRKVKAFTEELRIHAVVDYELQIPDLPRYNVAVAQRPSLGDASAPITIVEFSDFQCPYCRQASVTMKELKRTYGEQLRIVYRHFPLSQHQDARPAAAASHCADEQERFWEYHDKLFERPDSLSSSELRSHARELGLDLAEFESCLASNRPESVIVADESDAKRLNINGTPAIFINGVKLIGLLPLPLLKSLIDHEIAQKRPS